MQDVSTALNMTEEQHARCFDYAQHDTHVILSLSKNLAKGYP